MDSKWWQMSEEVSKMQREHGGQRGYPLHLTTCVSVVVLWGFYCYRYVTLYGLTTLQSRTAWLHFPVLGKGHALEY